MRKNSILAIALSLALVVMMFAGCGSKASPPASEPPANPPAPPAATTPAPEPAPDEDEGGGGYVQGVTDTEILIADSVPISGNFAQTGIPTVAGLEAYIKMVNEGGGIDGRKIKYLHQDDEADPVKGKAYLQGYINDDKVFAIVEHFGTAVVSATIDDLHESGIPTVYFGTGIGQLYSEGATTNAEGRNTFPVQPIYKTEGQVMVARGAGNFNATKIGIVYTGDDAGKDMLAGAEKKCTELGIEFKSEQVAAAAPDVSAAVTSIKEFGPDFIIVAAIQATMPTIVKEIAKQGIKVPAITSYVNVSPAMSELVAPDINGLFDLYGSGWMDFSTEQRGQNLEEYNKWIDQQYLGNSYAMCGWIAGFFFTEGLRRLEGKEVTWDSFIAAMESAPIDIPFGGTVDYSGGKRLGTPALCMFKVDPADTSGLLWSRVEPLQSIDEILS